MPAEGGWVCSTVQTKMNENLAIHSPRVAVHGHTHWAPTDRNPRRRAPGLRLRNDRRGKRGKPETPPPARRGARRPTRTLASTGALRAPSAALGV